jgi:DNA polymerase III alpha subunit
MIQNKFDELVFSESDICNLIMQGRDVNSLQHVVVDDTVNLEELIKHVERPESLLTWKFPYDPSTSIPAFHAAQQLMWHMPDQYKNLDIAQHVLSLCNTEAELQRCGTELLLYQERGLFDLLRYLTYLVDVMTKNHIIWGVGRGSSVASHVLYLLGIHRINSMYYNLDIAEFLR